MNIDNNNGDSAKTEGKQEWYMYDHVTIPMVLRVLATSEEEANNIIDAHCKYSGEWEFERVDP